MAFSTCRISHWAPLPSTEPCWPQSKALFFAIACGLLTHPRRLATLGLISLLLEKAITRLKPADHKLRLAPRTLRGNHLASLLPTIPAPNRLGQVVAPQDLQLASLWARAVQLAEGAGPKGFSYKLRLPQFALNTFQKGYPLPYLSLPVPPNGFWPPRASVVLTNSSTHKPTQNCFEASPPSRLAPTAKIVPMSRSLMTFSSLPEVHPPLPPHPQTTAANFPPPFIDLNDLLVSRLRRGRTAPPHPSIAARMGSRLLRD